MRTTHRNGGEQGRVGEGLLGCRRSPWRIKQGVGMNLVKREGNGIHRGESSRGQQWKEGQQVGGMGKSQREGQVGSSTCTVQAPASFPKRTSPNLPSQSEHCLPGPPPAPSSPPALARLPPPTHLLIPPTAGVLPPPQLMGAPSPL